MQTRFGVQLSCGHLGGEGGAVQRHPAEQGIVQPPFNVGVHGLWIQTCPSERQVHSRPPYPFVGQQGTDAQHPRIHIAPIGVVSLGRVVCQSGVGLQVANHAVHVHPGLNVLHAAVHLGTQVHHRHVLHQSRQLEGYRLGQLYRCQVAIVGVHAVEDGLDGGLLYIGQSLDVGVEKQIAVVAERCQQLLGSQVGDGAEHVSACRYRGIYAPQCRGPPGGILQVHLGALFQHHVVYYGVAIVAHLFPPVVVEPRIHKHTAVVGLQVEIGHVDTFAAHLSIHGEVGNVQPRLLGGAQRHNSHFHVVVHYLHIAHHPADVPIAHVRDVDTMLTGYVALGFGQILDVVDIVQSQLAHLHSEGPGGRCRLV